MLCKAAPCNAFVDDANIIMYKFMRIINYICYLCILQMRSPCK